MKALIVGYGSIGKRHINNLSVIPHCKIIVCTKQKQDNFLKKKHCQTFRSLTRCILEEPDVAFVTNETSHHIDTAIKLAKAGIPLFIEKPLSNSMDKIENLISIIKEKKIITMVGCNLRFHPCIKKLKKLVSTKKIGRVISVHAENRSFLPDWHPYEDYSKRYAARNDLGGGATLTNIHEIDYLYWIFGNAQELYSISGKLSNLRISADDFSYIVLQFKNKIIADIHLDFFQNPPSRYCKISGTNGTIYCDLITNKIKIYYPKKKKWAVYLKLKNYNNNDMYIDEMRHFVNCVKMNQKTINSVSDSIHTLRISINAKMKKSISVKSKK